MKLRPLTLWDGSKEQSIIIPVEDIVDIKMNIASFVKITFKDGTEKEYPKNNYYYSHWVCFINQIINRWEV